MISGSGTVRHDHGRTAIESGDCFIFKPGRAHQLINDSPADLVILVVADNPTGESYHYPDEAMWIVNSPESGYVVQHPTRREL
ncbi:MAG: cupin domain-containing protein [Vulcanimicrobiaceae bacterium]